MEFHLQHAFRIYRDLEEQNQAIKRLEEWLKKNHPAKLKEFLEVWENLPHPETKASLAKTAISAEHQGTNKKGVITLPGLSNDFYLDDPIVPGGSFTWAEATHDGDRLPQNKEVVHNMIALAEQLQVARDQIGKPMQITCWYYQQHFSGTIVDQQTTHHVSGDSVDFWVKGYTGKQLAELLDWWPGGLGTYNYVPYLVNVDIGPHRRWQAGYPV